MANKGLPAKTRRGNHMAFLHPPIEREVTTNSLKGPVLLVTSPPCGPISDANRSLLTRNSRSACSAAARDRSRCTAASKRVVSQADWNVAFATSAVLRRS